MEVIKIKRWVIGDIHGKANALKQVLKRAKFNYDEDLLIVLGDVVDGGPHTYEVVEELLKIKKLVCIIGNHDGWFINLFTNGVDEEIWLQQGGYATIESYGGKVLMEAKNILEESLLDLTDFNVPVTHQEFFNNGKYYYVLDGDKIFVHGGLEKGRHLHQQEKQTLLWDRNMWYEAANNFISGFNSKTIFIGHTTTKSNLPEKRHNVWNLDTGAGYNGKLTIMNIDTEEYFQSDKVFGLEDLKV